MIYGGGVRKKKTPDRAEKKRARTIALDRQAGGGDNRGMVDSDDSKSVSPAGESETACVAVDTQDSNQGQRGDGDKSGKAKRRTTPLYMLSARHYRRTARLYLECGDLATAMYSAGYSRPERVAQERKAVKNVRNSPGFQSALREVAREIELATCSRVATHERGSAALAAAKRLREIVDQITRPARPDKKKKW